MNYIFESFFGLSISLNIALTIAYVSERRRNKKRKETIDAQDLLMDLMAGEALVRVTRISPTDVFLRSPGGR